MPCWSGTESEEEQEPQRGISVSLRVINLKLFNEMQIADGDCVNRKKTKSLYPLPTYNHF